MKLQNKFRIMTIISFLSLCCCCYYVPADSKYMTFNQYGPGKNLIRSFTLKKGASYSLKSDAFLLKTGSILCPFSTGKRSIARYNEYQRTKNKTFRSYYEDFEDVLPKDTIIRFNKATQRRDFIANQIIVGYHGTIISGKYTGKRVALNDALRRGWLVEVN